MRSEKKQHLKDTTKNHHLNVPHLSREEIFAAIDELDDNCEIAPMEPSYGVRAVSKRKIVRSQPQYLFLWAGYDQGTLETRA